LRSYLYRQEAGNLCREPSPARALAGCLRDDSDTQVSSFNAKIIQTIQKQGGPKHPYRWLDKNRIRDDVLQKRNQDAIEAYRQWASSQKNG
jgi:hypothetical protein